MTEIFADTYYFIALLGPPGEELDRATQATIGRNDSLVTTEWVLMELANFLSPEQNRRLFVETHEALRADSAVVIVPADHSQFLEGAELYADRPDKNWSLTDCISFLVMRQRGIGEALTGDHHFEQAGFVALLKKLAPL